MVLINEESVLKINGVTFPAGSARGIAQTLDPIDNGALRRTVNGTLLDLTRSENRKFASNVSANDMSTPTLSGFWKGQTVTVECIQKIRQQVDPESSTVNTIRPPVADSVIGYDFNGQRVSVLSVVNKIVTFGEDVVWFEYRPILTMLIQAINTNTDEYGAEEGWSLDLLEV